MDGITSNFDLINLAKKLNIKLTAVIYKDELVKFNSKKNGSYILDLHDSSDTSTGHWILLYINGDKAIYFDSFGIIYPQIVKTFCGDRTIEWNKKQLQGYNTEHCGEWCIACLWHLQKGLPLETFIDHFNQFN